MSMADTFMGRRRDRIVTKHIQIGKALNVKLLAMGKAHGKTQVELIGEILGEATKAWEEAQTANFQLKTEDAQSVRT